jgi:hypothetical protein
MADGKSKVQRTVQFRFTMVADPTQLMSMAQSMAPFYQMFAGMKIRFLQNVDDPTRYVQVIEYEAAEAIEVNRQKVASDPRVQAYLAAWRTFVPGAIEVDVYRDVSA